MDFVWDTSKNEWLKRERFLSFEEIAAMIQRDDYQDVRENPSRAGRYCLVLQLRSHTGIVPSMIDAEDRIVLKTAHPSRRYHRICGDDT